jgi:hypothetical protein
MQNDDERGKKALFSPISEVISFYWSHYLKNETTFQTLTSSWSDHEHLLIHVFIVMKSGD